jgi:hypothetical protein
MKTALGIAILALAMPLAALAAEPPKTPVKPDCATDHSQFERSERLKKAFAGVSPFGIWTGSHGETIEQIEGKSGADVYQVIIPDHLVFFARLAGVHKYTPFHMEVCVSDEDARPYLVKGDEKAYFEKNGSSIRLGKGSNADTFTRNPASAK